MKRDQRTLQREWGDRPPPSTQLQRVKAEATHKLAVTYNIVAVVAAVVLVLNVVLVLFVAAAVSDTRNLGREARMAHGVIRCLLVIPPAEHTRLAVDACLAVGEIEEGED